MRLAQFLSRRRSRAGTPAPSEAGLSNPFAAAGLWHSNPARLIVTGGLLLAAVIVAGAWMLLANLRAEQLEGTEHDLESLAMVLAEQTDRSFQSIELIQKSIVEQIKAAGIATPEDLERRMAAREVHQRLKDQISALPHIDALVLATPAGRLINFSRGWPAPAVRATDNKAFELFKADPTLTTHIGQPLRSPIDGDWVFSISRRITGAQGQYLGVVIGVMRVAYFEQYFKTIARNQDHSIALFRRDGSLVARFPSSEHVRNISFANRTIFKDVLRLQSHGTVRQYGMIEDRELMISGRNLPHYPLAVVVIKSVDVALAGWRYAALYVAGAAIIIAVMIGGIVAIIAHKIGRSLQAQNRRLDAALNNMSQGLTMFDGSARLIVCNRRYQEMFDLPDEAVKPGTPLRDILYWRLERKTCFLPAYKSVDAYIDELLAKTGRGTVYTLTSELMDGRTIAVTNHPMAGGGWVATHDDIIEARRREDSFRLLFDGNPMPMWVHDLDTMRFLAVNDAAITHYGYSREQFLGMTVLDMRPPDEREPLLEMLRDPGTFRTGERFWHHRKADGTLIDVATCFRILDYEGQRASLVAIQDVTARKQSEDQLRRMQHFLDTVVENVPVPILVKKLQADERDAATFRYTLINRAAEELFGISRDYIIGKTPAELFPPDQADYIVGVNTDTLDSKEPLLRPDHPIDTFLNGRRLITAKSVAVRDEARQPQYMLTVLEDVTERRRDEQGIARMAHHDTLTDLPNRMTFNDAIEAAIASAQRSGEPFALLSLDLDGFKEANDTYGHSVGDALLREVARRLQLAADSAFVARIGGDEFTIIVNGGPQPETATEVAERLIACLSHEIEIDDRRITIGATVGGALYPTDGEDANSLMISADVALYRAKAAARGSVVFYEPSMGEQLRERRAVNDELRLAIQRDELLLHYQPQKTMAGEAVGFEALVRWQSPKRGLVSPAQFIPIAEESGLIVPLGNWVLAEACREAASWREPLTIAVNVSPAQFRAGDLPLQVQSVLMQTGLAPARLELEITESVLIDDFSRAISILCRLKALGVRIALDDFGSGYSSLSYLHSFSFDKIKIDRTFVGDLESNRHSKAIVRAVIDLGHSLNVPTVAEGVETQAQYALLESSGCDEVQGYFIGRPAPIADYADITGAAKPRLRSYAAAG